VMAQALLQKKESSFEEICSYKEQPRALLLVVQMDHEP